LRRYTAGPEGKSRNVKSLDEALVKKEALGRG